MKNINPYSADTFEFHKEIVKSKNKGDVKSCAIKNEKAISDRYDSYGQRYTKNELHLLGASPFQSTDRENLIKLYSYKSKPIQALKVELTTGANNKLANTCPYCTIGVVSTMDHFVPKGQFPEFSVNPKNLFPCCSICNGLKGEKWRDTSTNPSKRLFLNLYCDELPQEQYLLVDVKVTKGITDVKFGVDNALAKIDKDLFSLVKTHYETLGLCERFREKSPEVISDLERHIEKYSKNLPLNIIIETVKEICDEEQNDYGHNYWKAILKKTLINDNGFISKFE